jgi:enterobacterial common antigen flippase
MGGAQVVVLLTGFARTKLIALVLGASGVGLIGIFNAFSGNVSTLAGWGLGTSGVRLIAGADESERSTKIAAVRRMGWALSLLGFALALILFCPVGEVTFASPDYAVEMAIVSLAVPCLIASSAWSAVLQASGKLSSLASVQIFGALAGLLVGLPAIWFWGSVGIALGVLLAAAVPAAALGFAVRNAGLGATSGSLGPDLRLLVKIGGALMLAGWLAQLSAYLVRLAIVRQEGLEAAGYYHAAFAIAGGLPSFVFAAMGADFFPRVAASESEEEAGLLTEQQIIAGLLLGSPLIVALLTLGKLSILLLYTDNLEAATTLLPWMAWGVFVRIISWPLGFWMMARRGARMLLLGEGLGCLLALAIPLLLMEQLGLVGASAGFCIAASLYAFLQLWLLRLGGGSLRVRTVKPVLLTTLMVAACQWLGSLSDSLYFGLLPTALAAGMCVWASRRLLADEKMKSSKDASATNA